MLVDRAEAFYNGDYHAGIPSASYPIEFHQPIELENREIVRGLVMRLAEALYGDAPDSVTFSDECLDCGGVLNPGPKGNTCPRPSCPSNYEWEIGGES